MAPDDRAHATVCAAVIAFALVYVGVDLLRAPRLWFDPIAGTFTLAARGGATAMGYYGLWLWAGAAALLVGGAAWVGLGWRGRPSSARALALGFAWSVTATVGALAYFAWNLWPSR